MIGAAVILGLLIATGVFAFLYIKYLLGVPHLAQGMSEHSTSATSP